MTWVKLDDGFPTHPKVLELSDRAFRAYVTALCYAAQHLTDGFVPTRIVGKRAATELIDARLIVAGEGGWVIHDYLSFNPSRESVETKRRADVARKRGGFRVESERNPEGIATASERPVPSRPVPSRPPPFPPFGSEGGGPPQPPRRGGIPPW